MRPHGSRRPVEAPGLPGVRVTHRRFTATPHAHEEARVAATGEFLDAVAAAGRGASLWIYQSPNLAIHVPEQRDPGPSLAFMLDPSEKPLYWSIDDDSTPSKTGQTATVAGREVVKVKMDAIPWGCPPIVFRDHRAPQGTIDHPSS